MELDVDLEFRKEVQPQAAVVHPSHFDEGIDVALQQIQGAAPRSRYEGLFLGIGRNAVVVDFEFVFFLVIVFIFHHRTIGTDPGMVQIDVVRLFPPAGSGSDRRHSLHRDPFECRHRSNGTTLVIVVELLDRLLFGCEIIFHRLPASQDRPVVKNP